MQRDGADQPVSDSTSPSAFATGTVTATSGSSTSPTVPTRPKCPTGASRTKGDPGLEGQGCDPDPNYGHGGRSERRRDGRSTCPTGTPGSSSWTSPNPTIHGLQGRTTYPAKTPTGTRIRPTTTTRRAPLHCRRGLLSTLQPRDREGLGATSASTTTRTPPRRNRIGSFRTRNSLAIGDKAADWVTLHNAFVVGTDVCMSWYSDWRPHRGCQDPTDLNEVGFFVPPAGHNPVKPSQRGVLHADSAGLGRRGRGTG